MNNREKEILAILRRPAGSERIADMLQISRSRCGAYYGFNAKAGLKAKLHSHRAGILRSGWDNQYGYSRDGGYPLPTSASSRYNSLLGGRRGRNIAHNLALGRDVHLLSVIGDDFMAKCSGRNAPRRRECLRLRSFTWSKHIDVSGNCQSR